MDLEILKTALRAAGFSEDDAEWQRAITAATEAEAAGAEGTVDSETTESREIEVANETAADAVAFPSPFSLTLPSNTPST